MDEKKNYAYVGKVEIGTDEYRDLIEGIAEARADANLSNSRRWDESRRADEMTKQYNALKPKYDELIEFIRSDDSVATKLRLYRIERQNNEEDM